MNDIFEKIKKERGGLANIHSSFADFLVGVKAHYEFYNKIMLAERLPLSRSAREFLAVKTSEANTCPYCIEHHNEALKKQAPLDMDDKKKSLLSSLAELLTKEPWKASLLQKKAFEAGFSNSEYQHAVMIVAYFNFANRCVHAMGLDLEEDFKTSCN